ncbi:hypothetical protein AGLY_000847 [Aphis glycines]|uniref:Uncharacterized protein n=1 Tax=Aphis glycines TaxID=307491 RepID=A0A6G0U8A3_APHGL|nr:hypothetical protein AGLY_000847 [Aphis glycines]
MYPSPLSKTIFFGQEVCVTVIGLSPVSSTTRNGRKRDKILNILTNTFRSFSGNYQLFGFQKSRLSKPKPLKNIINIIPSRQSSQVECADFHFDVLASPNIYSIFLVSGLNSTPRTENNILCPALYCPLICNFCLDQNIPDGMLQSLRSSYHRTLQLLSSFQSYYWSRIYVKTKLYIIFNKYLQTWLILLQIHFADTFVFSVIIIFDSTASSSGKRLEQSLDKTT